MQSFLDTPEDMEWLRDVHKLPVGQFRYAILHGQESFPDKVELWMENDLRSAHEVWERDGDGWKCTLGVPSSR